MSELIHQLLERNARKYPFEVAVRWPGGDSQMTWEELNRHANALSSYLQEKGVVRGDKAALFISNRPEFLIAFFGILKTGAVAVPINVKLTPDEISHILTDSDANALVFEDGLRAAAEEVVHRCPGIRVPISTKELSSLAARYPANDPEIKIGAGDLAEILYTSGTTGKPKGVLLNHNSIYLVGSMMAYKADIRYRDRCLHLMPLSHSAPLNLFLVGSTYAGATSVLGNFTPQALLELCHQEKITHFFGAPVAYLLANRIPNISSYDLSAAKFWIYGGAPMSRDAVTTVMKNFPGKFMGVYGLTEAGPNGMALHPDEHPQYAGSIGCRGTVNSEIRVVNEAGEDIAPGEVGEILIKSPTVMMGYYNLPEATAETLRNGWIHTGDLAEKDKEGYLWIKDRKKDMIITGGVNVYSKEVEDVIALCPGVADVAVVGVPHPEWGETVMALVVATDPGNPVQQEDLFKFCRTKLADYKIPRIIKFTAAIPRNSSGKVQKHIIKAKYRGDN